MTAVLTIDPRDMDLQVWADQMVLNFETVAQIPRLTEPARWQDWAASLLAIAAFSGILIANPYSFTDWRDWATRTNFNLDNKS